MNVEEIFLDYAKAFELTYRDDDWSRLKPFFSANAVYLPGDGSEIRGRDEVLAHLRESVEALDRRFESRGPEFLSSPAVSGDQITVSWRVVYKISGVPDLVLSGSETASFDTNEISMLEDTLDDSIEENLRSWLEKYGSALK